MKQEEPHMKNRIAVIAAMLVMLSFFGAAAFGADVLQGRCLFVDQAAQTVTVAEYDLDFDKEFPFGHPTAVESVVNIKNAKIGARPQVGDILRIAYVLNGQEKYAVKVMNVSRQSLKK